MLAALYVILNAKGDLSDIGRGHPSINKHKYYLPSAKFPTDISHLLPPSEGCWWEHLAAEHGDGGVPPGNAAPSPTPPPPPPPSPPCWHLPKVMLIMGPPPEDSEDEMEVDQLEESPEPPSIHKKGKKKAAGLAATSRKRKLTSPPPHHSKKWNVPVQLPPEVIEDELESEDEDNEDNEYEFSMHQGQCALQATADGSLLALPKQQGGVQLDAAKLEDRYRIAQHKVQEGKQPAAAYRKTSEASDLAASASSVHSNVLTSKVLQKNRTRQSMPYGVTLHRRESDLDVRKA
ncbi:hypothetical protein H4582DRAFT_2087440 [Lactarius indigo]|nr:hypothetical protein H4582DRAFT_2087440 [Lactarius indigo]